MPNWCMTELIFEGDPKTVEKLDAAILAVMTKTEQSWYSDIAENLGIKVPDKTSMRGKIEYTNDDELEQGILRCSAEDAWGPQEDFFYLLAKKLGLRYCYRAEEFGCDVACVHNDPEGKYFPEKYMLDIWEDTWDLEPDSYYFETKEECLKFLSEHSGQEMTWEEWMEELEDMDDLNFHEYSFDEDDLLVKSEKKAA